MDGPPIDLDHFRRARRLLTILVDRFGVAHFLAAEVGGAGSMDERACEGAVSLASAWIERRSGRTVAPEIEQMMRKELRRLLVSRIQAGAACIR